MRPRFAGGTNIAMKIPAAQYEATLIHYRDVLGLEAEEHELPPDSGMVTRSVRVAWGPCTLWLDQVENYTRAEIWLDLETDDLEAAVAHLSEHGASTRDELEPFPPGTAAHWIANPAGVPHVLHVP